MPHGCPIRAPKAKQSKDDSLRKMADRIQARAIRRCGELLKQIHPAFGARTDLGTVATRSDAAEAAGLSEHQRKTALRVASVPDDEFNAAVESDSPETVTQAPCVPPGAPFGSVSTHRTHRAIRETSQGLSRQSGPRCQA